MLRRINCFFVPRGIAVALLSGFACAPSGAGQMMTARHSPVAMQPASAPVAVQTMAAPKSIQRMGIAPSINPAGPNAPIPKKLAPPLAASQMFPAVQSGSPAMAMPTPQISSQAMGSGLRKNGAMQVYMPAPISKSKIATLKAKAVGSGLKCTPDGPMAILSISDDSTQSNVVSGSTIYNDRLSILGCHFGNTGVVALLKSSDPSKAILLTQLEWIGDMNGDRTGWSSIVIYGTNFPYGKPGEKSGPWRFRITNGNGATINSSQFVYFVNDCNDPTIGCK